MSQLSIRNSLLTPLAALGYDIAYENSGFDPSGLDEFLAPYFIPTTSGTCGKTSASSDDERGMLKVSVFIKSNAKTFDNKQLQIIDEIKAVYYNGVIFGDVQILEVEVGSTAIDDGFFRRDVDINYTSFQARV